MAKVTFKAKVEKVSDGDRTLERIVVPKEIKPSHVDRDAFRVHPRFAAIANSDYFFSAVRGEVRKLVAHTTWGRVEAWVLQLEKPLPPNCTVDRSGFLAVVTFDL